MKAFTSRRIKNSIFIAATLLTLAFSLWWRIYALKRFDLGYDEGIHLIVGKLWAAGFTPYSEIFVSYPPLFLWSLGIPWALFNRVEALQLLMTVYSLLGVLAVIYLGAVYHSRLAGIAAGILLSLTPTFFIRSFSIMTETPSIAVATAAVALAEKYRRDGGWGWAALTGVAAGIALSLKILPVYIVPLVGLMVLSRHFRLSTKRPFYKTPQGWRIVWRDIALLAGSFLLVFALPIAFTDIPAFFAQTTQLRIASREMVSAEAKPYVYRANNEMIVDFFFANAIVTALALYGAVFVVARNLKRYAWLLVWLALIWATMYVHIPLRAKHLPIFLPVLVLWAGFGAQHTLDFFRNVDNRRFSLRTAAMSLVIVWVWGMVLWDLPRVFTANNGDADAQTVSPAYRQALDVTQQVSSPADCVISDDPVFLHRAGRIPAPELAEASQTRINTGFLTLKDVTSAIEKRDCQAVAAVTKRFQKSIPGLSDWLAENYAADYTNKGYAIYFGKKRANAQNALSVSANFEGRLQLTAVAPLPIVWQSGQGGYLSLYWTRLRPSDSVYIQRLSLRRPKTGKILYQSSRALFEGFTHPLRWQPGETARDTFYTQLPPEVPAGTYDLLLSLCEQGTDSCLSLTDASAETQLYLTRIEVVK